MHTIGLDGDIHSLWLRWESLCRPFTADTKLIEAIFADLVERYAAEGRYYHNLHHIHNVLNTIEDLKEITREETAVKLAAWFHDIIYETRPSDTEATNEAKSAQYAAQALPSLQIPEATINLIRQLILATQLGSPAPDNPTFHVLLDADLATLAAAPDEYDHYARAIRQEFAFVPDEQYRIGRRQILTGFLERERIFLTEIMYARCEQKARLNIQREIEQLG
jgi:predicted metal-dependent HD superfamily phosphohydrolase